MFWNFKWCVTHFNQWSVVDSRAINKYFLAVDIVAEVKDPEDVPDEEPDDDPEPAPPKETPIQTFTQFMQTVEHMRTYLEVNHLDAVHLDALEQQVLATKQKLCRKQSSIMSFCTPMHRKDAQTPPASVTPPPSSTPSKNGPQHPLQDSHHLKSLLQLNKLKSCLIKKFTFYLTFVKSRCFSNCFCSTSLVSVQLQLKSCVNRK